MSENSPTTAVFTSADTINLVFSPRRITGSLLDFRRVCFLASRRYDTVTIDATVDGGVRMMFSNADEDMNIAIRAVAAAAEQEVGP